MSAVFVKHRYKSNTDHTFMTAARDRFICGTQARIISFSVFYRAQHILYKYVITRFYQIRRRREAHIGGGGQDGFCRSDTHRRYSALAGGQRPGGFGLRASVRPISLGRGAALYRAHYAHKRFNLRAAGARRAPLPVRRGLPGIQSELRRLTKASDSGRAFLRSSVVAVICADYISSAYSMPPSWK